MTQLYGDAALALALAAHGELLVRLRVAEPARPWWFGYARDGANLAAALMLWGAYLMVGFPGPVALMAGMLTCLGTYLLDWLIARALKVRHPRILLSIALAGWVAFIALLPARATAGFEALLSRGRP
jgi:hypothetical protein